MTWQLFNRPNTIPTVVSFLILISTAIVLILNGIGLANGITDVLPHLFYIPIILMAYYFPRRALFFTASLSVVYCALVFEIIGTPVILVAAIERGMVFLLITAVVSYLSYRIQRDAGESLRLASVVQSSSDAIIGKTLDGIITDWNRGAELIYGYTSAEILGKKISALVPRGHQDDTIVILEKIKKGETVERYETERLTKDGRTISVSLAVSPITDYRGQIIGASTIAHDITGRKRLQDRILRSKTEWEITFNAIPDLVAIIDRNYHIVHINRAMAEKFGVRPEDVEGRTCFEMVHSLDKPLGICPHTLLLGDGKTHTEEIYDARSDSHFRVTVSPLTDHSGTIFGSVHILRDITEAKLAEEALRDYNQRLADIVDFLPDPLFVINAGGVVIAWNRAIETLTGIPAKDMIGKRDYEYSIWFHGKRHAVLIDYVLNNDILSIQKNYPSYQIEGRIVKTETNIVRPDGSTLALWITATPLNDQQGTVIGAIESLRDVTDIKRIERAMRESKKYLDKIINTIADPVFVKDRAHNFVLVNDAFCKFTGHPREALMGKSDYDFFRKGEADTFWQKDEEVFNLKVENENQEYITDAKGVLHTIITKKTLYKNTFDEQFIVGIIRDVTRLKQIEDALQQTNKKLNMLSSITRHDIANQLTALRTYLELCQETEKDPEILGFIRKGDESAEAIGRQLEFTRYYQDIGVKAPEWQDAATLIHSAASQLPLEGIDLDVSGPLVQIYADFLLEKVFYNLMENSIRHGVHVTRMRFSFSETENGGLLEYSDDGVGISAEDKQRLFIRGFGKHTGLGLFLSREILSITGITINETGEPGKGVRFEILLPANGYRLLSR
jgi:PAS domain S-box-containing protein